jgi:fructose/tagatose bisphosphate aldolase
MLLTGSELRQIFALASPFRADGQLKPEAERVTLLAANANFPFELEMRAFAMAAAAGEGSPIIVQLSHNAAEAGSGDPGKIPPLAGVKHYSPDTNVVRGAELAARQIARFAAEYGARFIAVSLDHFKVPVYAPAKLKDAEDADGLSLALAEARVRHAVCYMQSAFGEEAILDDATLRLYALYLTGKEYITFRRDFLRVVERVRPAWGMIDTEMLPPVLDFVVTRDITDAVRHSLGNHEIIIEAEFGATGTGGQALEYRRLTGAELDRFAAQVVSFVHYTGADAIAYPIGMEHAAKKDQKHEPDINRLEVVQTALFKSLGRYIPFAQHGGTGAAKVARGLVGKNNVNTHFLVAGAAAMAEYGLANIAGIRAGDKKYCGATVFNNYLQAVAEAALFKLGEVGSLNMGLTLQESLGIVSRKTSAASVGKPQGAYDE